MSNIRIIHVIPNARVNKVTEAVDSDGEAILKIHVTAIPEKGKANDAVLKTLSDYMGVPKSALSVVKGTTARRKHIRIDSI